MKKQLFTLLMLLFGTSMLYAQTWPCNQQVGNATYLGNHTIQWGATSASTPNALRFELAVHWNDPWCCVDPDDPNPPLNQPYSSLYAMPEFVTQYTITPLEGCYSYQMRIVCADGFTGPWSNKTCVP